MPTVTISVPKITGCLVLGDYLVESERLGAKRNDPSHATMTNMTVVVEIDSGHTAWILVSMAMVQLMLPGLAFFYGWSCPTRRLFPIRPPSSRNLHPPLPPSLPPTHSPILPAAGLLHRRSVVTMIMQNFAAMGVVTLVWFWFGFSLCFGHSMGGVLGSPATFPFFSGVDGAPLAHAATSDAEATTVIEDIPACAHSPGS